MKTFEDKIKKLEQLIESGSNYIWRLKNQRLTQGFWDNYGNRIRAILNDIEENHFDEYKEYDRIKNNYSKDQWAKIYTYNYYRLPSVDDLMCW